DVTYQVTQFYTPAAEKPQVYLIQSRMYADDFRINARQLALLKVEHEKRIDAMSNYVTNNADCRSQLLASYFGSTHPKRCGICDNCINYSQRELTTQEFEAMYDEIRSHTKNGPVEVNQLVKLLKPHSNTHAWQAINYLEGEELLERDEEGRISLKS
ncbi:MAG: hypothetical protein EOO03_16305, partial [Chitinophagaceae bacterium]